MYQKLSPKKNWKKSLLDCNISRFLKFFTLLFSKIDFFPSKNHVAFSTIERYDIELTTIKTSDKNILPQGGVQAHKGYHFSDILKFCRFWHDIWYAESAKHFEVQNFIVYGHHSLTRKIGFRVIS